MTRWLRARLPWVVVSLLLLLLLLLLLPPVLVQVIGYGIASAPNRGRAAPPDPDTPPVGARLLRVAVSPPDAQLVLWALEPPGPPRGTVLLLHGIRAGKGQLRGLGERLRRAGFTVLLPDLRGHGGSSGDYLSYGVHESRDLSQVLDRAAADGLVRAPLAAVGFSYGGSIALQLAARDPRVAAVVSVATFADLRSIVPRYVERAVPLLGRLIPQRLVREGIVLAQRLGRFDATEASSLRAAPRTRAPWLLLHGEADAHIPAAHSRAIHAAAPERGALLLMPGLDHDTICSDPQVGERILAFLHTLPG